MVVPSSKIQAAADGRHLCLVTNNLLLVPLTKSGPSLLPAFPASFFCVLAEEMRIALTGKCHFGGFFFRLEEVRILKFFSVFFLQIFNQENIPPCFFLKELRVVGE